MLRLSRDLLDQQIIDVNGRKVVRVTDVTFEVAARERPRRRCSILEVDIGMRSIFRRLLQGVLPPRVIRRLQRAIPPEFDPLGVLQHRRARSAAAPAPEHLEPEAGTMHPADLADIVEELSPDEREAIFETIDSEVAAEALSEVDPKMQASILESLEPEKAADIVEEMSPDEAADVLAELEEETSEEILDEMESEPKTEVQELLEFDEDTAGGLMNTEYVALHENATVADAMAALRATRNCSRR